MPLPGIAGLAGRRSAGLHHGLPEWGTCLKLAVEFPGDFADGPVGDRP
jgi:hypothetical protein